jgi:membrane-bound serine protease (ClpP class)
VRTLIAALAVALTCLLPPAIAEQSPTIPGGAIWLMDLDGAVGPATSDYLVRGFADAEAAGAELIVIRMNTPGGLDGAMRDIISAILASSVPVASWVAPGGARAASAGTYILYASHIAAMAPATNLGAATPVSIGPPSPSSPTPVPPAGPGAGGEQDGGDGEAADEGAGTTAMERKMVNDAAAYIRGLANLHGRNAEWAERAVRQAESLSSDEALSLNVIDLVAADLGDLVEQVHGLTYTTPAGERTLDVADAPVYEASPDWRTEFLATITNPNLVLILGMIGFYGIILEFYNPGSLVPGTIGVICLLLAGYSLQLLPVNYAGLALLVVGIALMVAEAMAPSFGILGTGGVVAFVFGGIILFDTDVEAFQLGWPVLLAFGLLSALFVITVITLALRVRRHGVTTGVEQLVGQVGEALEDIQTEGMVRVGAEIWHASTNEPVTKGEHVRVTEVNGLNLAVQKEDT